METAALQGQFAHLQEDSFSPHSLISQIAELKKLVEILSDGKYVWESTFDAIQDPVLVIAKDYRIARINRAGAVRANMDIRHIVGNMCYHVLAGRDTPCVSCPLTEARKTHVSKSMRLDPLPKSGRAYEVNAYPLFNALADTTQFVLHYRDITEEENLQRKLIQSEKMSAIGTLAGGIAHEINNPLGGILAFTQIILRKLAHTRVIDDQLFADIQEIESAALRCKDIVSDLLEFSRMPSAEEPESVDLNATITKILDLLSVGSPANSSHIVTDLLAALPMAYGKPHKIQQVLLNLITNALYAMKEKPGTTLTVRTSLHLPNTRARHRRAPAPSFVCVDVIDEGEGIEADHLTKIFDPFFTTKKQGEGTGLGLSISYGIVKEYGGRIDVESTPGKGTRMSVILPIFQQS